MTFRSVCTLIAVSTLALTGACAAREALIITASADDPAAERMRLVFTEAHAAVSTFWGEPFPGQVEVTLAADRASFDAAFPPDWGIETQCWMVGAGVADLLLYLSPSVWAEEACDHDPNDARHVLDIAVHELAHVYHGQVNPTRDFTGAEEIGWFIEGLAVVVAGQLERDRYSDPAVAIREGAAPAKLQNAWSGQYRYAVAGSITNYIDQTYGRGALYDLMRVTTETELLDTLGVSEQQLLDAWRNWVLNQRPGQSQREKGSMRE
ncbi:MAG: hypothetical protein QNJ07_12940 [Woeseiaceae bacterium]|nr:hypothetical protein [Woeseiaceae bacterium]